MVDPSNYAETIGSVTRARPGDRLAPDRVSDFGPADVDRLVQQRAERIQAQQNRGSGVTLFNDQGGDRLAFVGLALGAVAVLAALMGG